MANTESAGLSLNLRYHSFSHLDELSTLADGSPSICYYVGDVVEGLARYDYACVAHRGRLPRNGNVRPVGPYAAKRE
jgi:hypothetical protein